MSSHRTNRGARLVVAIAMVGALVAGPLAGLGSAQSTLNSYTGDASGFALRVVVDLGGLPQSVRDEISTAYGSLRAALPADAADLLPASFPFTIDQRFIETLAQIGEATKAQALLGTGFTDKVEATKVGDSTTAATAEHKIPSADLPVLNATVGQLTASVLDGPKASADGVITDVSATLEGVGALLPAELAAAFDDLVADINAAIATVNGELDTALGTVADTLVDTVSTEPTGLLGTVLGEAGLSTDDVTELTTELTSSLNVPDVAHPLETTLATLVGLDNDAVAQKTADNKAVSDATSKIASVGALGLISVGVIDLSSHSEAAGVTGSAKNSSTCSIADVKLGNATDGVGLDGKTLYVGGVAIPVPDADVAGLASTVGDVMETVGLSIELCDSATSNAAADGTSASQSVSAFRLEFAPKAPADIPALGVTAGDQLVKVIIDPTVETSVSAQVGEVSQAAPLPATGAAPLATIATGLALTVGAIVIRRKIV